MSTRDVPVRSPARAALGWGDLLWLLHTQGKQQTIESAPLLGFEWIAPEGNTESGSKEFKPPSPPPKAPAKEIGSGHQSLQACHFSVISQKTEPSRDHLTMDNSEVFTSLEGTGDSPPPTEPLSHSNRMAVFLSRTLRTPRAGKSVDITRLATCLAQGRFPRHLPRISSPHWGDQAALIVDGSLEALPLQEDLIDLMEQAHLLSGGQIQIFYRDLQRGWIKRSPGRKPAWCSVSALEPHRFRRWLLAGDLGSLGDNTAKVLYWQRRLGAHAASGGSITLLSGAADTRWRDAIPHQASWVEWDFGQRLTPKRLLGGHAPQQRVGGHPDAEELLAALALAVTVEPSLLRKIRLELGLPLACELAAWNHPDAQHCVLGMHVRPEKLEYYREKLKAFPLARRQRIAAHIQFFHKDRSRLIQLEEEALTAVLADGDVQLAQKHWITAVRTLREKRGSRVAQELSSYLARTNQRAHAGLLNGIPALEEALEERTKHSAPDLPNASHSNSAISLYLVQTSDQLWLTTDEHKNASTILQIPPSRLFKFESSELIADAWQPTLAGCRLAAPSSRQRCWRIRTPQLDAWVAQISRPSWALEWGRDKQGLYAVAPSPLGNPVKLYWDDLGGDSSPTQGTPPSPHGFKAKAHVLLKGEMRLDEHALSQPIPDLVVLGVDQQYGLYLDLHVDNATQRFRWIEPGSFSMGSPESEAERFDGENLHEVTLTEGYWLADTACTQALWRAVIGENPSLFRDNPDNPVEQVSWYSVQAFLGKLNALVPGIYAGLPTEAQWEYACRAGTRTPFFFGDNIALEQVNYGGGNGPYADGEKELSRMQTIPVKSLPANEWGLYEMHGNVWEWCADNYGDAYSLGPQTDPLGPPEGDMRVLRGGSWRDSANLCRSANRFRLTPTERFLVVVGFRLALGTKGVVVRGPFSKQQVKSGDRQERDNRTQEGNKRTVGVSRGKKAKKT